MGKIKAYLYNPHTEKEITYVSFALLSASAVLRKDRDLRETLSILRDLKFDKRKIYEALLQTYLFAGYPSALISLSVYSEYFENNAQPPDEKEITAFRERGEKNCRKIYGNKYEKLINNINSFSPELSDWLVTEGYGKVLGRKGLSFKEREVCNIASLTALKFENQLYSHINGGHRLGLQWEQIEEIIESLSLLKRKDCVKFGKRILDMVVTSKSGVGEGY